MQTPPTIIGALRTAQGGRCVPIVADACGIPCALIEDHGEVVEVLLSCSADGEIEARLPDGRTERGDIVAIGNDPEAADLAIDFDAAIADLVGNPASPDAVRRFCGAMSGDLGSALAGATLGDAASAADLHAAILEHSSPASMLRHLANARGAPGGALARPHQCPAVRAVLEHGHVLSERVLGQPQGPGGVS